MKLLTYALNAENQLKNINEVPNGLECNCICPGCKEPLIAKTQEGQKSLDNNKNSL